MNRKDDHLNYALKQKQNTNDFDNIRFVHHGLQTISADEIDLSTNIGELNLTLPLYINAMTGGTEKAKAINDKLSLLANHFNIPIASGSLSIALRDPSIIDSFTIIRKNNPNGIVIANIGADKTLNAALNTIEILKADVLQIHINQVQEMLMPEGERDFRNWIDNIKEIVAKVNIPVIVKEVGFGMNRRTIKALKSLGVNIIDISGRGGTNFATIENTRRDIPMPYMENWGLSTVESLLEANEVADVDILASGGIRNPLDVVKALALGAKAVGMASYFLHLINGNAIEVAINKFSAFLNEIKTIMTILGASRIEELKHTELIFSDSLVNYIIQRNIDYKILISR